MKAVLLSLLVSAAFFVSVANAVAPGTVVYAVNCGGPRYESRSERIVYQADQGFSAGTPSDYGTRFRIERALDGTVYQTERYHTTSFAYTVPLEEAGDYVLTLKFSEVWFDRAGEKVFDVRLGSVPIVRNLDIFDLVGKAVAHDEYIPLTLKDGQVSVKGQVAAGAYNAVTKKLVIQFVKKTQDNPKINAIVLTKGTLDNVPKLPKYQRVQEEEEEDLLEDEEDDDFEEMEEQEQEQEEEEDFDDDEEEEEVVPAFKNSGIHVTELEEEGGLFTLLFSSTGLVIFAGLAVFVVLLSLASMGDNKRPAGKAGRAKSQ